MPTDGQPHIRNGWFTRVEFQTISRLFTFMCTQGVKDWEAVLQKAKGMFLKCPPRELVTHAPAYIKETLDAGG